MVSLDRNTINDNTEYSSIFFVQIFYEFAVVKEVVAMRFQHQMQGVFSTQRALEFSFTFSKTTSMKKFLLVCKEWELFHWSIITWVLNRDFSSFTKS